MLVLSRRIGESIVITTPTGEEITVTILRYGKVRVRLGIEAPTNHSISRKDRPDDWEETSFKPENTDLSDDLK